jgi:hypothetical protein
MSVSHRKRVKSILSSFAEWLIDEAFITLLLSFLCRDPVAGCGEGGHPEGKQGARRMSELIARQGRCLCTFGSSVPCRLRMAIAG